MSRYYDFFLGLFFLVLFTLGFLFIISHNGATDQVRRDKRLDNVEIRKILKDNYKSFQNISEYLLNNEIDYTIVKNSEGKLISMNKFGENQILDDKVEVDAEILINKFGFLSITEDSNEIDFIRPFGGKKGKIFKYKPGGHATNEFLEDTELVAGWYIKFH